MVPRITEGLAVEPRAPTVADQGEMEMNSLCSHSK